jgi:hypothetical protein
LIKNKPGLKVAGIYCVPCEYRNVYVGKTGRSTETRCKEHMRFISLGPLEKSTVESTDLKQGTTQISVTPTSWIRSQDIWIA